MKRKIYVASSWRNNEQPLVVEALRKLGHEVYDFKNPRPGEHGFSWSEIDEDWMNWTPQQYKEAMQHPIAQSGFNSDFDAMKWADCCVMVLPCGRSANTEAGWMKGAGKEVFVFQSIKQEPELMYKIHDGIFTSFLQLQEFFLNSTPKQKTGIEIISEERNEHFTKHRRTIERDVVNNQHFQLSHAASLLCSESWGCMDVDDVIQDHCPHGWNPEVWEYMMQKPYEERLVIAGALIAAEIDRLKAVNEY